LEGNLYLSKLADDHFELCLATVSTANGDFTRISLTSRDLLASVRFVDGLCA